MATLKLSNINKIYPNGVQAVFDFNLEIKDKEFIVFVGPSGCGKSTTLRMIAGLEEISSGEFYIDDNLMNFVEPKDRNIAMVFQSYALYPHMTVYQNMEFALKLRKLKMPIYQPNEEAEAIRKENFEIMKLIKALDKKYMKSQNSGDLLIERKGLYEKIYANEEKIAGMLTPIMGIDNEAIKKDEQTLAKYVKDLAKKEKRFETINKEDEKLVWQFDEYFRIRNKQIKQLGEEIEYLKNNEVVLTKSRVLNKYERNLEINKVAESIDLVRYLYRKPSALSGGQRQRVALGRAIVRKPKVFLMDEPLSNLDAKLRVQTRSEIAKIHRLVGATTIYVTHDQTEALTLADRIVIMKDGYIQQIGTPVEVYENPANKFVGGFIGSPSMNFVNGTLDANGIFRASEEYDSSNHLVLDLGKKALETLKDYIGKEVIMGIRPEDIYPSLVEKPNLSEPFMMDVEYTELLGKEHVLYCLISGQKVVLKTLEEVNVKTGDSFSAKLDLNKVFFFDKESEKRIY